MQRAQLKNLLLPLFFTLAFLGCVVLWYKYFTLENYGGDGYPLSEAEVYVPALGEPAFPEADCRVRCWCSRWSDVLIENDGEQPLTITVRTFAEADKASVYTTDAHGSCTFYNENGQELFLDLSGSSDMDLSQLRYSYSSARAMDRLKIFVLLLLGCAFLSGAFLCILPLIPAAYSRRKGIAHGLLGLSFVLALISLFFRLPAEMRWETYFLDLLGIFLLPHALFLCMEAAEGDGAGKERAPVFAGLIGTGISLFFYFLVLNARPGSLLYHLTGRESSLNRVLGYIAAFFLFLVLFLLLGNLLPAGSVMKRLTELSALKESLFALIILMFILGGRNIAQYLELKPGLFWLLLSAVLCGLLFLAKKRDLLSFKLPSFIVPAVFGLLLVIVFLDHTAIYYLEQYSDAVHTTLFYRPLYYIGKGLPFTPGLDSAYGHYALFYLPFFLIFGADIYSVGVLTGLFSALTFFFLLLCICRIFKQDLYRILAGILLLNAVTLSWLYLQNYPCRFLFPAILFYHMLREGEKESTDLKGRLAGYLIAALGVIWNTESGMVCAGAWVVFMVFSREDSFFRIVLGMIRELFIMALEAGAAFACIAAYDLLAAARHPGAASELVSTAADNYVGEHMSSGSNGVLLWGSEPWLYIMILLFLIFIRLLSGTALFGKKRPTRSSAADLGAAVLFLGYFLYWMIRPEEYAIVAVALLFAAFMLYAKGGPKTALAASLVMAVYLCSGVNTVKNLTEAQFEDRRCDAAYVRSEIERFAARVPEDCYGLSPGLPMIYLTLGWDLRFDEFKSLDAEDCFISDRDYLQKPGFERSETVDFAGYRYYLYRRTQ
ncbi:MAG: hypothetical protein IK115_12875 [Lachnospiraceae bacterium]|nr:hypothetical protein [Lachnospiraceae bacterium]